MSLKMKRLLCSLFLVVFVCCSGCSTLSGAMKGAAEGMKKDWKAATKLDDWIRKNLW